MINNCQTLTCNRDLRQEKCVESRINRLQSLVQNWSRLPEQVYFVSTLKGKVTWYLCYFLELFCCKILQNLQLEELEEVHGNLLTYSRICTCTINYIVLEGKGKLGFQKKKNREEVLSFAQEFHSCSDLDRLFTALFFLVCFLIIKLVDRIARELDASAKKKT